MSRAAALREIKQGVEAALRPEGFEPAGQLAWLRRTPELHHVIALLARRGMYDVQWGIVSPEATHYLWGVDPLAGDVGQAIVSGTPSSIQHPAQCQSFRIEGSVSADAVRAIVAGLSTDLGLVEIRLRSFTTRREVRDYLLLNREPKDRRDFVIPANLPLKLFTAATLAVIDADPGARDLVAETEQAMGRFKDDISSARLERLRAASAALCG
jgi:hypothetical protein